MRTENSVFLSFTVLANLLQRGEVGWDELDSGLFFLGCTREHVMTLEPGSQEVYNGLTNWREEPEDMKRDFHRRLVAALEQAEAEGRADWFRKNDERHPKPLQLLKKLLEKNGYEPTLEARPHYSYPDGERLIESANTAARPIKGVH